MAETRVVWGSPGTGKTTYLLGACDHYLKNNARVLMLSHTKAAATEITERLAGDTKMVVASTIHSLVFNMLGITRTSVVSKERMVEFGKDIGVPISGDFDITGETERFIEEGDEAMSIISRADAKMVPHMQEFDASDLPLARSTFEFVSKSYTSWKDQLGYIDFNDMLTMAIDAPFLPFNFDAMIVDEAQDLSPAQWAVLARLIPQVKWCIVAGDPDQALYTWGGASPTGMQDFCAEYEAEQHTLPQSYRIPRTVHDVAMSIREQIVVKAEVSYLPRSEKGVCRYSPSVSGLQFNEDEDTLVLYRTHSLRRELENELLGDSIPYRTLNGMKDPWRGQFGMAVQAYNLVQDGKKPTARQAGLLKKFCRYNSVPDKIPWRNAMDFPQRFMNYMTDTEGKESKVRLSTIHGATGKEADRVVLYTGMTQRELGGARKDPDAEHRVFYVGVTRARHTLDVVYGDLPYEGV